MALRGQAISGICYIAWDTSANSGKISDVANHTIRLIRDGIETTAANLPLEVDSVSCPGLYKIDLTATEINVNALTIAGKSSTAGVVIVPVQITTSQAIAVATQAPLVTSNGGIWTDLQINQWAQDGIGQIAQDVNCIWQRESIAVTVGNSVISLPPYVRTLRRVTWRGRTLDAVNFEELTLLGPATNFVSVGNSANVETSISKPLYYAMHPTNPWDIRLYPTPNESFAAGSVNPYAPVINESGCCIDYYRQPDSLSLNPTISIPRYIQRRAMKAYTMWKAFAAEGKGQDLKASSYWHMRYQFIIQKFRDINEGCFVSKRYAIDDGLFSIDGFRYPRPMLPPRFERTRY